MANITEVDYEKMPGQAATIRTEGNSLKDNLNGLFTEAKNMHENRYGLRYNSLITELNSMIPVVDDILKLVIDEIPVALETVARNYALADGATPNTVNEKEMPSMESIETTVDVGMRFISTSVSANKDTIETKIQNALENLSAIESEYSNVVWDSESATAFSEKFSSLKSSIEIALNSVKTNLSKLMVAAEEDISNAEQNNTVQ